jgi:hypothetical protein
MAGFQGTATRQDAVEAARALIESERRDMHTTLVGEVVSYDSKRQRATIKPRLKQTIGGKTIDAPNLEEVPVQHMRAGGLIIHKPLKAGDEVKLSFLSRSMDQSGEDGSAIDAHPGRMHDLSDCIATPCAYSKPKELADLPGDRLHFGTEDGKSGLQVKPDGTWDHGKDGDTLWTLIVDFLNAVKAHTHMLVPMDAPHIAKIDELITRAEKMKAS